MPHVLKGFHMMYSDKVEEHYIRDSPPDLKKMGFDPTPMTTKKGRRDASGKDMSYMVITTIGTGKILD
jgi:hypothetical protein